MKRRTKRKLRVWGLGINRRTRRKLRQAWRRDGEWISMALVVVILTAAGAFLASESMAAFTRAAATTLEQ
jgi:hypothetical protein